MRRALHSTLVLLGVFMVLWTSTARANGFWSFDEQWWREALTKPRVSASTEGFVATARPGLAKSPYSFLEDYSPL